MIGDLYKPSLSLLTDLYQLTMAYGYWKTGRAEEEAVFNLFFRKHPFQGSYTIAAGLEFVVDYLERFSFEEDGLAYLGGLTGNDGNPLFEAGFLEYLGGLRFTGSLKGVEEGEVVFPHEPLLRIQAPVIQAQLLETPLLNLINFQTLIATKAARISQAAAGEPVLEFGLRRAQGVDGALSASRAAYLGGCAATSNVLAGKLFGIPVKGTHAHSWVMSFENERDSFTAYAKSMPNNCVFLVDTYDTVAGVRHAIEVGKELRETGNEMVGIRLDSGDMAKLSREARRMLDEAGFNQATIVASNDLDEYEIEKLKKSGAQINVWGVGTRLVTAFDQPALGGVYKLAAIRKPGEPWRYRIKLSEEPIKVSNPGIQQIRRFFTNGKLASDVIYDEELGLSEASLEAGVGEDLLKPIFEKGVRVYDPPPLAESREWTLKNLDRLPENPVPVELDRHLFALKEALIQEAAKQL